MIEWAWNFDGVRIPGLFKADSEWVHGIAVKGDEHFAWMAKATPQGYYVEVRTMRTGRRSSWTGPTFNMMLEVAAAVRRH